MNEQPHPESRARLWISIGVVVVATLVAVMLVPDNPPRQVERIPPPPAPPAESPPGPSAPMQAPAKPAAEPAPAAPKAEAPESEDASRKVEGPEGSAARAWLAEAGAPTPEQVVRKARQFQQQGRLADAWLLYFKAAREGSAEAAMRLAEQADPAYHDAAHSVLESPDLVQAHKWYARAAELGAQEAPGRLQRLLARVAKRAAAGDERAALLLQEWKSK